MYELEEFLSQARFQMACYSRHGNLPTTVRCELVALISRVIVMLRRDEGDATLATYCASYRKKLRTSPDARNADVALDLLEDRYDQYDVAVV